MHHQHDDAHWCTISSRFPLQKLTHWHLVRGCSRHIGMLLFRRVQKILLLRLRFLNKAPANCAAEIFITFRLLNEVAWYGVVTTVMIVTQWPWRWLLKIMTWMMNSHSDGMMDNEDFVVDNNMLRIVCIIFFGSSYSENTQFRHVSIHLTRQDLGHYPDKMTRQGGWLRNDRVFDQVYDSIGPRGNYQDRRT